MAIARDEVLHVAKLARLELTEEELERLTQELGAILEAVGKVSEPDDTTPSPGPRRRGPGHAVVPSRISDRHAATVLRSTTDRPYPIPAGGWVAARPK